ncbi:TonB-dependent receptor [Cognatiyoonia sp. IB215446]|uniref:TonB-dependent receptor n=1 Tax=Cognatiyoonia sp. IB215446 TaxID=3097355 RepID=UPI002A11838A|nr:TonB-dependent receptor [Cognatiyoonia sp. IB215446]MDX8350693.1 TonB-dependent receptor [Cognatiyoonia sp. IB215446]
MSVSRHKLHASLRVTASIAALAVALPATAQSTLPEIDEGTPFDLGTIIFQSDRDGTPIEDVPRAVKNIDTEELEDAAKTSTNFSQTLPQIIPGFGTPVFQNATRGLFLRGRDPLFLIDSIPITSSFGVQFQYFDQSIIDNIEVLYGPTALYGRGASGGVIQFFTKDPTDEPQTRITTGVTSSLADDSAFDEDSLSYRLGVETSGRIDNLGYVGVVSLERHGAHFQPDGQRIAPTRLDDFDDASVFGKLTYDIDGAQSVEGFLSYGRAVARATDFTNTASEGSDPTAVALFQPQDYEDEPQQEGIYTALSYRNNDLAGGDFRLQLYYSSEEITQIGSDIRERQEAQGGTLPDIWPGLFQTNGDDEAFGLRADYAFDVSSNVSVNIGADYRDETNEFIVGISDPDVFDATGVYDASDSGPQAPPVDLESFGLFVQTTWDVTERTTITGGVRYDSFEYDVGPASPVFARDPGLRPGGSGDADGFSYNIGTIFDLNDSTTLFASFAQGFSLPQINFAAGSVDPGVSLEGSGLLEPIVVDSYEVGVRGFVGATDYSLAAFYAESELGSSPTVDPATGGGRIERAPQRNYGFEFEAQRAFTDTINAGIGVSWNEGENDTDDDGNFEPLSSLTVLPLKVTLQADWQATQRLNLNGSVFYLGDRDAAFDDGVDNYRAEGYVTADVGATFAFDNGGELSMQVTNVLNEEYIPLESQSRFLATADRRFAGPGRELVINYAYTF